MNKVKKIIPYLIILGISSFILTGCTIKLDGDEFGKIQEMVADVNQNYVGDEEVQSYKKIELQEDTTINSVKATDNTNVSYVGATDVYSDGATYMNIYGYNLEGEIVWNYKTEPLVDSEKSNISSKCLDPIYGAVCIIENGVLKQLDLNTGEVLWTANETFEGKIDVEIGEITGTNFVYVYSFANLYVYSYDDGNLIKRIDFIDDFFYQKFLTHISEVNLEISGVYQDEYFKISAMFSGSQLKILSDFNNNTSTILITNNVNYDKELFSIKINAKNFEYEIVENVL